MEKTSEKKVLMTYKGIQVITQYVSLTYGPGYTQVFFGKNRMFNYSWNTINNSKSKNYSLNGEHFIRNIKDEFKYSDTESGIIEQTKKISMYLIDKMFAQIEEN